MRDPVDVVHTADLTRRSGALVAVDAMSIRVEAGRMFGPLGSNGTGKRTAVKMVTTLRPPTSGTATVAGFDIRRAPCPRSGTQSVRCRHSPERM
jgi:ABC-2 type transport system ATP-binding protein